MRIKSFLLFVAVIAVIASGCQNGGLGKKVSLKTGLDSTSYALGILMAQQNKVGLESAPGGKEINLDLMAQAFHSALKGDSGLFSVQKASEMVNNYFQKEQGKIGQKNLEEGNAFLEKNKNNAGVKVTPSGLQYEIIKTGTGPIPGDQDMVKVHYHGTLVNGKVFDSSVDRGEPAEFPVGGVIPGWTEALKMMTVGSKWKIYLPASLGYGERAPQEIGPNKVLIFEVELLEILPPQKPAAAPAK
jgi:FKBP-type peptidyl-prolyl cis-trans isomerase